MVTPTMAYPDKPVSFIVPWPPGDLEDVLTRMIADRFQSMYGVPAAVVNKPSGGGGPFPGAMVVANAPPDGSMIGSFTIAVPVIGHLVGIEGLREDTFVPVGIFLTYPFVLATRADAPYDTIQDLAKYAKSHKVALGHFGVNLIPTKITLATAKEMGFSFSSEGSFDSLDCNTLASGDADVINTTIQTILPCMDKVKILVSITRKRIPLVPHVPTVGEINPDLGMTLWNGLFVRKGTPQEVIEKVSAAAKAAIFSKKAQKLAADTGAELYWMGPEKSRKQIGSDRETFARINRMLAK
ncbi:MAG: tripartite tricarboxylate transporter substrate binding protein [Deltaproteobacteria bacterium]|nr:tripartite tricarboxylate transporter substrate binding protein [Deltaproteobacteria bacterium]